jgi:hypothetical protein
MVYGGRLRVCDAAQLRVGSGVLWKKLRELLQEIRVVLVVRR